MAVEVVDTNVWVNMDKLSVETDAERACVQACQEWGAAFSQGTDNHRLAADYTWAIFNEYRRNIKPGGLAEQYLNRLLSQPITRLELVEIRFDENHHAILPENISINDPNDRKFIAVSLAFQPPAPIVNATDTDWAKEQTQLAAAGIPVKELCPDYLAEKI
jgi:hypothetical protein